MVNSQKVYISDSNNERQSEMAAETGNTYNSETMKGAVKILTTKLRLKACIGKIVLASEYCNSDRQPKISTCPPPNCK